MKATINDEEVEVLDREQSKVDATFDVMTFTMQGETEFAKWTRVFPNPIPSTHKLEISWGTSPKSGAPMLTVQCVPIVALDPDQPHPIEAAANEHAEKALAQEQARKALDALPEPELHTRAAELGVKVKNRGRAAIIAEMLEAVATKATPAQK